MMISLLFIFNTCLAGAQIIRVTQHPANVTFCEGSNGVLSCVVFDNDNNSAADSTNWFRDDNPAVLLPSNLRNNTRNGDVVTSVLTIENVTLNDNGTGYFCFPSFGIMSNIGVLSIITDPASPTITGTTPLSSTSFTVNWTITDPNHNYIITWINLRTGMMEGSMTVPENTNSYTVTGLNGVDNYNVSVAANNSCGMMMSDPITVYGAPNAVVVNDEIPSDDITNQSIVVRWSSVNDIFPVNYTVRWYRGDDVIGTATVDGLSYTITGLTANTSYNVTVVAINTCCGAGPVSNVVMVMTNMRPPTLPPPTTTTPMPSSTPSLGPTDGEDDSNTGVIVGVVVAVIVIVIIVTIVIIGVIYYIKKNNDSTNSDKHRLKSPTGTGGSHTASITPAGNVPHQTAPSGVEYAMTTKATTTTTTTTKPQQQQQQQPTEEYAVVDKSKKHAAATQGIHYADLQDLPASESKPPTNQDPTLTYAMVA